jgi:hypothetical protein
MSQTATDMGEDEEETFQYIAPQQQSSQPKRMGSVSRMSTMSRSKGTTHRFTDEDNDALETEAIPIYAVDAPQPAPAPPSRKATTTRIQRPATTILYDPEPVLVSPTPQPAPHPQSSVVQYVPMPMMTREPSQVEGRRPSRIEELLEENVKWNRRRCFCSGLTGIFIVVACLGLALVGYKVYEALPMVVDVVVDVDYITSQIAANHNMTDDFVPYIHGLLMKASENLDMVNTILESGFAKFGLSWFVDRSLPAPE